MRPQAFLLGIALAVTWLSLLPGCVPADPNDLKVYIAESQGVYHYSKDCANMGAGPKTYRESKCREFGYKSCADCRATLTEGRTKDFLAKKKKLKEGMTYSAVKNIMGEPGMKIEMGGALIDWEIYRFEEGDEAIHVWFSVVMNQMVKIED